MSESESAKQQAISNVKAQDIDSIVSFAVDLVDTLRTTASSAACFKTSH